jgi:hypothetical protein
MHTIERIIKSLEKQENIKKNERLKEYKLTANEDVLVQTSS